MTWTDVTESSNTWDLVDYRLYVLVGYWDDGYTVEENQQWSDVSESNNTWVVIG